MAPMKVILGLLALTSAHQGYLVAGQSAAVCSLPCVSPANNQPFPPGSEPPCRIVSAKNPSVAECYDLSIGQNCRFSSAWEATDCRGQTVTPTPTPSATTPPSTTMSPPTSTPKPTSTPTMGTSAPTTSSPSPSKAQDSKASASGESSKSSGPSMWIIIVMAVAGVLLVAALAVGCLLWRRRQRAESVDHTLDPSTNTYGHMKTPVEKGPGASEALPPQPLAPQPQPVVQGYAVSQMNTYPPVTNNNASVYAAQAPMAYTAMPVNKNATHNYSGRMDYDHGMLESGRGNSIASTVDIDMLIRNNEDQHSMGETRETTLAARIDALRHERRTDKSMEHQSSTSFGSRKERANSDATSIEL